MTRTRQGLPFLAGRLSPSRHYTTTAICCSQTRTTQDIQAAKSLSTDPTDSSIIEQLFVYTPHRCVLNNLASYTLLLLVPAHFL